MFNLFNLELCVYVMIRMLVRFNGELVCCGVILYYSLSDYNLNVCKYV